jgi:hypothetical protein
MSSPLERALAVRLADVVVGEAVAGGPAALVLLIADDARVPHRQTARIAADPVDDGTFPDAVDDSSPNTCSTRTRHAGPD